jgi:hypothetical protein
MKDLFHGRKSRMADTDNSKVWVNTLMEKDDVKKLDEMVSDNGSTRAAFIRLLIDREYEQRKRMRKLLAKVKNENNSN